MSAGAIALRVVPRAQRAGPLLRPLPRPPEVVPTELREPPQRYRICDEDSVRVLRCPEAPTLRLRADRGLSFTASEARAAAPGSIFLDGVAVAAPFADLERQVYNLDHHEGCVRAFTLACCEQALVLLRKGLDLRRREWTLYANDADLDTVLAVWLLLNHLRLDEAGGIARARVLPLVRLQGAIDAHGLELEDLCAFPPDLQRHARAQMDRVRAEELALRASGEWNEVDLLQYFAGRLRLLDAIAYSPGQLRDVGEIEELARAEIGQGSVAVVCRSELGIYEVERQLRRFHGARLGVIALQREPQQVTLRQVEFGLPATLEKVYAQLNWVDPAAGGQRSRNCWGGSGEIGGSPRLTGTRLDAQQIAEVLRIAYRVPRRGSRLARSAGACALAIALVVAASRAPEAFRSSAAWIPAAAQFPLVLLALALLATALGALRAPHAYRPRALQLRPAFRSAAPALALGLLGGCWIPSAGTGAPWADAGLVLALALACELIFRGGVRTALGSCFPRAPASRARPASIWSASSFAVATLLLQQGIPSEAGWPSLEIAAPLSTLLATATPGIPVPAWLASASAALGFGLLLERLRERSGSVLAPIAIHAAAAWTVWFSR